MTEGYLVPDLPSGGFFREEETVKRSRFIVTVGRAASPEAAHVFIEKIREEHSQATHNCWAFNAGEPGSTAQVGASDDGEPKGTAGRPMLTAVLHSGIGEVVVVVTRYFGGILLGAGGLVRAYSRGAAEAVNACGVGVMHPTLRILVDVPYAMLSRVEFFLKSAPVLVEDKAFAEQVTLTLLVRDTDAAALEAKLIDLSEGTLEPVRFDEFYYAWKEVEAPPA